MNAVCEINWKEKLDVSCQVRPSPMRYEARSLVVPAIALRR